MTRSWLNHRRF